MNQRDIWDEIRGDFEGKIITSDYRTGSGLPNVLNVFIRADAIDAAMRRVSGFASDDDLVGYVACRFLGGSEADARNAISLRIIRTYGRRDASKLRGAERFSASQVYWCSKTC